MNCREAKERWHRQFDEGETDVLLEAHIMQCAACRAYAAQMDRVTALLGQMRTETEGVRSQRNASRHSAAQPGHRKRRVQAVMGGVMGMAALIAVWMFSSLFFSEELTKPYVGVPEATESQADFGFTLRGESRERYLAVAKPVAQSNVQVVWLYPASR